MPRETITPQYVNQPRLGKTNGSIKVGDRYYSVKPDLLQHFAKGVPITIEWYCNDFQGTTYYHVKDIIPDQDPNAAPVPTPSNVTTEDSGGIAAAIREQTEVLRGIGTLLKRKYAEPEAPLPPSDNVPF